MSLSQRVPKLNSIFVKIAATIMLVVGVVAGTLTLVNNHYFKRLAESTIAQQAQSQTFLVSNQTGGALKYAKGDLITEMLDTAVDLADGAALGAVAVGVDGGLLAEAGGTRSDQAMLLGISQKAIETGTQALSADGFSVAVPVRYGASNDVVGAIAMQWSAAKLVAAVDDASHAAILVSGATFLLAVIGALLLFGRLITTPLGRMQFAIKALGQKKFDIDIPARTRGDEIGQIGQSLEELRQTLETGEALRQDSTYKSAAFMGSSAAMMLVDQHRKINYINPRMIDLLSKYATGVDGPPSGRNRRNSDYDEAFARVIGRSVTDFDDPSNAIRTAFDKASEKSTRTMVSVSDMRISLSINAIQNEKDEHVGHVIEWTDVTESWLNNALIDAINSNQLKAEFSPSGKCISANQPFCETFGRSEDELKGRSLQDMLTLKAEESKTVSQVIASVLDQHAFHGKMNLSAQDGRPNIVDGSLSSVNDHDGKPTRILLLGRDVTLAEAELTASRKERIEAEREQSQVVEALRIGLRSLNAGDLTACIDEPFASKYEELRQDYNDTVQNLGSAMSEIATNARNIMNDAREISSTADGLSRRTETTAATLEQTAAALDELTSSIKSTADGAAQADQAVRDAKVNAEESGNVVLETVSAMDQIAGSSERITSIIKVIDDIAFQTNLLALNAGVEAARAGDAGRGFAVVASEVRALAQRSSEAAREINDLIAKSATQVKHGVDLVGRTGNALQQIVLSVSEISSLVSNIAVSSKQQSAGLVEINSAVIQLDQSTQQNAARLEETTAASDGLTNDAVSLVETVSHFRVDQNRPENESVVRFRPKGGSQSGKRDRPVKAPQTASTGGKVARSGARLDENYSDANGWEDF